MTNDITGLNIVAANESSMPEVQINAIMEEIGKGNYGDIFETTQKLNPTLDSEETYIKRLTEILSYGEPDALAAEPVNIGEKERTYQLVNGDTLLGTLTLLNENGTWQIRYLDMPLRSLANSNCSYTVNPDDNYGYQEAEVQIYPSSDITFAFFGGCQGAQQYGYLHSNNSANVIGWTREGSASQWRIEPVDAAYIAALQNYAPAFGIITDDVTGIDGVEQTENWKSVNIYDLQGRRVTKPQRGNIYIIDGQKVKF